LFLDDNIEMDQCLRKPGATLLGPAHVEFHSHEDSAFVSGLRAAEITRVVVRHVRKNAGDLVFVIHPHDELVFKNIGHFAIKCTQSLVSTRLVIRQLASLPRMTFPEMTNPPGSRTATPLPVPWKARRSARGW
jgi:hypothetical protein